MSYSIIPIAQEVETALHSLFVEEMPNPFNLDTARLYGVNVTDDGDVDLVLVEKNEDIYEILATPVSKRNLSFTTFTIITTGWAAPLNDNGQVDGAPSLHPLRRRVRLSVTVNLDGVASVMRFEDTDEAVVDAGAATGSLADAVVRFVTR